jgi:hypothetical protein
MHLQTRANITNPEEVIRNPRIHSSKRGRRSQKTEHKFSKTFENLEKKKKKRSMWVMQVLSMIEHS